MIRLLLLLAATTPATAAFDAGRAGFSLRVNDELIPYRIFAVYALPRETLEVSAVGAASAPVLAAGDLAAESVGRNGWRVVAPPAPGVYPIAVDAGESRITLNVVVMHPASAVVENRLNGYRIGRYPERPLNGDPVYLPPEGYILLDRRSENLRLSPHFTLSQFPSKQAGSYPKYLALRERLLLKLELLLEYVNAQGIEADTFTIMSGYRTPYYNAAIGNVAYSRHVYGGAADIYIDVSPKDGVMDDLNGDGRLDVGDAQLLYRWANALFSRDEHTELVGGLGVYRTTAAHGPFLHVDARGRRARWGVLP